MKGTLLPKQRLKALIGHKTVLRDAATTLLCGFLLAAARIAHQPLPLAACLVGALPCGISAVTAAVGAVSGYVLFCGGLDCGDMIGVTALMLAADVIFRDTPLSEKPWFFPALAAGVTALLSALYLLGGSIVLPAVALWLAKLLLSALATVCFQRAIHGERTALILSGAALLMGAGGIASPIDLGLLCAAVLLSVASDTAILAGAGIALDLTGSYGCGATAVLLFAELVGRMPAWKSSAWRVAAQWCAAISGLLFFRQADIASVLALSVGLPLGTLVGRSAWFAVGSNAQDIAARRLDTAADVLETLRAQLPYRERPAYQTEMESVYDGAAERICRCCPRFHRCWQHRAETTLRALTDAAEKILQNGFAKAEDFSNEFRENCCHMEGFLTALNQELEGMLYRRRYCAQLGESKQILADEFGCVAAFLRQELPTQRGQALPYQPIVGVSTVGKDGSRGNGDRGACFAASDGNYYILLCDGMGTGEDAGRLSGDAVRLLRKLLHAGMLPEAALKVLNGVFLLRGNGCFATVDLLRIDLRCGAAELYKWGAAPSFYRTDGGVKRLGEAQLPPGVGTEEHPTVYRMELRHGETLVLATDGADSAKLERGIAAFTGDSVKELAALLVSAPASDDMTAVAVALKKRTE